MKTEEKLNINYYNIFNSMEQRSAEKSNKSQTQPHEAQTEKPFIKKNNIILTHTSLPNP